MSKFTTHCFRDFKKFIGELTATSAGIHVAIKYMDDVGLDLENSDPWAEVAKRYQIKVDGLQSKRVLSSAARLNIVNVYSGFDLYLSSFRKVFFELREKEWTSDRKDTPFDEFHRNISLKDIKKLDGIVQCQIDLIDYYRLARNAIVHPSKDNEKSVYKHFQDHSSSLFGVRSHYGMTGAPNSYENLDFHDVKIFARTLLDLLPEFDETLDPGDEKLKSLIPYENWPNYNESRKYNAALGFLKNEYGIDHGRALNVLAH